VVLFQPRMIDLRDSVRAIDVAAVAALVHCESVCAGQHQHTRSAAPCVGRALRRLQIRQVQIMAIPFTIEWPAEPMIIGIALHHTVCSLRQLRVVK